MSFLRSFFFNFAAVFFINQVGPGIQVGFYEHVPNIGADIVFSAIVGFLNASIFPALFILELNPTPRKFGALSFCISFASYIFLTIVPAGIEILSIWGIIIGGAFTWAAGFLTNYLEWRQDILKP